MPQPKRLPLIEHFRLMKEPPSLCRRPANTDGSPVLPLLTFPAHGEGGPRQRWMRATPPRRLFRPSPPPDLPRARGRGTAAAVDEVFTGHCEEGGRGLFRPPHRIDSGCTPHTAKRGNAPICTPPCLLHWRRGAASAVDEGKRRTKNSTLSPSVRY